jgi:hypothetical protein
MYDKMTSENSGAAADYVSQKDEQVKINWAQTATGKLSKTDTVRRFMGFNFQFGPFEEIHRTVHIKFF